MARFLIVEDDEALTAFLRCNREAEDREAEKTSLRDGAEVGQSQETADVIVLDWTLPGGPGAELYRRDPNGPRSKRFPVVIAAVGGEAERIRNLIQALLCQTHPELGGSLLRVGDIELDRHTRRVFRAGREVHLSLTEFRLLEFLMATPGHLFSREEIRRDIWINERTVDVHMGRLRKALKRGRRLDPIRTVRGAGYALKEEQYFNSDRKGKA
jgi:two-component system, OmpR family, phosphate regulon response regulator PhoB